MKEVDCSIQSLVDTGLFKLHSNACIFGHIEINSESTHSAEHMRQLVASYPSIASIELEFFTPSVQASIHECTGGMDSQIDTFMRMNHQVRDDGLKSHIHMNRHIWLAHTLAREAAPRLEYVIRTRPDNAYGIKAPEWWPTIVQAAERGAIVTSAASPALQEQRRNGVPEKVRCMTDDQMAAGPTKMMDGYASIFPDFRHYLHTLPWFRVDFGGHINERMLAAHLHYRDVSFEEHRLGHEIHAARARCRPKRG